MTKVIDLTKEAKEEKVLKPTEFVTYLSKNGNTYQAKAKPNEYKNIEIVFRVYGDGLVLMLAYNDRKDLGNLYLGYINDEIV